MSQIRDVSVGWPDLARRAVTGFAMAGVALGLAWWGGWPFVAFWILAGFLVFWEWQSLVRSSSLANVPSVVLAIGGGAIVAMSLLAASGLFIWSGIAGLAAAFLLMVGSWGMPKEGEGITGLAIVGLFYGTAASVPIALLRLDQQHGLAASLFLFAIVWGSDVMAYFVGRTLGGPKLWPQVSPKKTWSGFLGGTLSGAALATAVAAWFNLGSLWVLFGLGFFLAIASQGGDLFESALKRHFDVKDASSLVPGHGGVMDRLDGFIVTSLLAVLIGLYRSAESAAHGLLVW